MIIRSSLQRTFVAIAGALAVSTMTIGAAVGPAQASSTQVARNA